MLSVFGRTFWINVCGNLDFDERDVSLEFDCKITRSIVGITGLIYIKIVTRYYNGFDEVFPAENEV